MILFYFIFYWIGCIDLGCFLNKIYILKNEQFLFFFCTVKKFLVEGKIMKSDI